MSFPVIALAAAAAALPLGRPDPAPPDPVAAARVAQPVHDYFVPFGPHAGPDDRGTYLTQYTHLGTDYGPIGPAGPRLAWEPGGWVRADVRGGDWGGMWHSLAGLAREPAATLDFTRCYPPEVRAEFQPVCRGVTVRARGRGRVKLEVKDPGQRVLWRTDVDVGGPRDLTVPLDPAAVRRAKYLNWVAEPGSDVAVDRVGLAVDYPPLRFADRQFLVGYAKLARCAVAADGRVLVKDHAHRPAGAFEGVPASGMYALAAAAAAHLGVVDRELAARRLYEVRRAVAHLPKADGWLPHFASTDPATGGYRRHPGTEFSTVDTALTYHGLILAARVLADRAAEHELLEDVRGLRFDRLRGPDRFLRMGLTADGRTPLAATWRDWGGEAALVALLERLARGADARPRLGPGNRVADGVGFIAEVQSLFYPQFDADRPDAVTGANWLRARRELAADQRAAVARDPRAAPAAAAGVFGLSAGEGYRGRTYVADGLRTGRPFDVLHPHYMVMAAQSDPRPRAALAGLRGLEDRGLMPPWGLVENVTPDLAEYLPVIGSLNAAFECLAGYHLAVKATGRPDVVYASAADGPPADAVAAFYPR